MDREAPEPSLEPSLEPVVAEAAYRSAAATVDAVEKAAVENDDPAVAEVLEVAAAEAGSTVGRLGWLRHRLRKPRRYTA
jgi:hypothetical protein